MRPNSTNRRAVAWLGAIALSASMANAQTDPFPKPEDLDRLLAPIALYPDLLLAQMLLCATNPDHIVALNGWLTTYSELKGSELQDAAAEAGFGPSFVALALFPHTVKMMAEQIDWTTRIGQAFASSRSSIFASIQRLRVKARRAGALKMTADQTQRFRSDMEARSLTPIVVRPLGDGSDTSGGPRRLSRVI